MWMDRSDGLLADLEWVRRLARRLVYDTSQADDVAQDAWAAALPALSEHEPVLTLHRELDDDYEVVTAIVVRGEHLEAEVLDTAGRLDGSRAFPLSDLTKVDFGGAYERNFARRLRHPRTAGQFCDDAARGHAG